MPSYIYVVRPVRQRFLETMTEDEGRVIEKHFEYLKAHCEAGRVRLAGRCEDASFGIVIFTAASQDEARRFVEADPAVKRGVMSAELREFLVALEQ